MNKYLITFYSQPSAIIEAPNATAALSLCISKIASYEEISSVRAETLVDMFGLKFIKWPC